MTPKFRISVRRCCAALAFVALAGLGCQGGGDPSATAIQQNAQRDDLERRLVELESQINLLDQRTESMRREIESRLGMISETQARLAAQAGGLRDELMGPAGTLASRTGVDAGSGSRSPGARSGPSAPPSHWLFRLILIAIIVTAIGFIFRIFFGRWGDDEDGEPESGEEKMTDLGKIRAMAPSVYRPETDDPDPPRKTPET